jgi:lambda family phage minor tail protein L
MTQQSLIEATRQKLAIGKLVELFDLDLTTIGGGVYHFCSAFKESADINWKGNLYTPIPIVADGFEHSGKGTLPTPTLKISNVALVGSAMLNEFGDPLGCKVTRWVTAATFLDDGATPDPDQHNPPDIYVVERKKAQNELYVEFELSAAIDQSGRELPGRQVVRNYCNHRYRRWDAVTSAFVYTNATCSYAGSDSTPGGTESPYFLQSGEPTDDPSLDSCGKQLSHCKLRFGATEPLPFRGFPGAGRIRRTS